MISHIYLERDSQNSPYAQKILSSFKNVPVTAINKIDDIWGKVKKPYLQKRTSLNLFIGAKKGQLVKEAPPAYGIGREKHYYYVHAYNCIYECQYCYLQGYFNTPDLVIFINHEEILNEMQMIVDNDPAGDPWFHAGEYSDSLALSHITGELPLYFDFFQKNKQAKLELRTKSVNIAPLKKLSPLPNVYISFSLSPIEQTKEFDLKTPGLKTRLKAIKELSLLGYNIGIHLDPVIYNHNILAEYTELISELTSILPSHQLAYLSIGVVRFTKDVYHEVAHNYPDSKLLQADFIKSFDNKVRYNRPMRMWLLNSLTQLCTDYGIAAEKIYKCMEE
jgi:spore photoproduct lyase